MREPETLPYGPAEAQRVDLHGTGGTQAPVLVFIHGGGWVSGSPADFRSLGQALARQGILTACVGYRLAPAHRHPAQIGDVAAAVALLQQALPERGGDVRRLVIGGHSAGGHLAALLALEPRHLIACGGDPSGLVGVAGLSGVYDLARAGGVTWMRQRWVVPTFGADIDEWAAASPVNRVRRGAPPFWLANAEKDWGLHRHAVTLRERLAACGVSVEQVVAREANHLSIAARLGRDDDPTTASLLAFCRRCWTDRPAQESFAALTGTPKCPDETPS